MARNKIIGPVTEKKLDAWIEANRPDLASYNNAGVKGFYDVRTGPAHGFRSCGETWRDVAATLGAVDVQETE